MLNIEEGRKDEMVNKIFGGSKLKTHIPDFAFWTEAPKTKEDRVSTIDPHY